MIDQDIGGGEETSAGTGALPISQKSTRARETLSRAAKGLTPPTKPTARASATLATL